MTPIDRDERPGSSTGTGPTAVTELDPDASIIVVRPIAPRPRTAGGPAAPDATAASVEDGDTIDGAAETRPAEPRRGPAPPVDLAEGACIDRFTIVGKLGEGGMGVVVAAHDPTLDRKVAIKVLRAGLTSRAARVRLLREAQAMARVQHDGIVAVHEAGDARGHVFVVMELVDGETLASWQKARGWRDVLAAYLRAGRGLAAAHRAGLVHRDFKPHNVLVGKDGRVRVTDFGLVAASGSRLDDDARDAEAHAGSGVAVLDVPLTRTGDVMGTPAYMAPEQHRGEVADARADQFSFCVALWEGLYGVRPASARAGTVDPAPVDRGVPPRLEAILRRGLAVEPAERWPDLDALLTALADDPEARHRRRVRAGLVVGGLVIAATGAAVATMLALTSSGSAPTPCRGLAGDLAGTWDPARRAALEGGFAATGKAYAATAAARVAELLDGRAAAWTAMRIEACEATAVRQAQSAELLDRRMACLDRRRAELRATVDVLVADPTAALPRALDAVVALPPVEACRADRVLAIAPPPDDAAAQAAITAARADVDRGQALVRTGRYKDARAPAAAAVAAARAIAWPPLLAEALAVDGRVRLYTGDSAGAQTAFHDAIAAATAAGDAELAARLTVALIEVANRDARYGDVDTLAGLAEVTLGTGDERWADRAVLDSERGRAAMARRQLDDARAAFERALDLRRRHAGADSLLVARSLQDLGSLEVTAARWTEADVRLREVLALKERLAGPLHPDLASTLSNLSIVAKELERFDEGAAFLRRAIAILTAAEGDASPRLAAVWANLGVILGEQGKGAEALAALEHALAVRERALPPDHPDLASSIMNIGIALQEQLGRPADAIPYFVRARDILAGKLGPDHPTLAFALHGLGSAQLDLGHAAAGVPDLEAAYRIRSQPDIDPQLRADSGYMLAQALWAASAPRSPGRRRARTLATEASRIYAELGQPDGAASIDAWIAAHGP